MMDILSENRKNEYQSQLQLLLRLEEKRFVQGVSYFINKIPIVILKIQLDTHEKTKKQMYKILTVYSQT
jgi:hypothetical protein